MLGEGDLDVAAPIPGSASTVLDVAEADLDFAALFLDSAPAFFDFAEAELDSATSLIDFAYPSSALASGWNPSTAIGFPTRAAPIPLEVNDLLVPSGQIDEVLLLQKAN